MLERFKRHKVGASDKSLILELPDSDATVSRTAAAVEAAESDMSDLIDGIIESRIENGPYFVVVGNEGRDEQDIFSGDERIVILVSPTSIGDDSEISESELMKAAKPTFIAVTKDGFSRVRALDGRSDFSKELEEAATGNAQLNRQGSDAEGKLVRWSGANYQELLMKVVPIADTETGKLAAISAISRSIAYTEAPRRAMLDAATARSKAASELRSVVSGRPPRR